MGGAIAPDDQAGWAMSAPRAGFLGQWDRLIGPGATIAEGAGAVIGGLGGAALAFAASAGRPAGSRAALALLGVDLGGGVWCNATATCRRWYHRPGQGERDHLAFAAAHLHPFALRSLTGGNWGVRYGATHYLFLLATTAAVRRSPAGLRRPLAVTLALSGMLLDQALGPPNGAAWFAPAYYLKLLVGHALGPGE